MDSLYVIRERMQDLYSRYSIVADNTICSGGHDILHDQQ